MFEYMTGSKLHLGIKTCKNKKDTLKKEWVHMKEREETEREKRRQFDVSNTNAYYIYNHYAYCMLKCLLYNYVYYI